MGKVKGITLDIDDIIMDVYMFGDFSTEKTFKELVYKKCHESGIPSSYMYYANSKIEETLNV